MSRTVIPPSTAVDARNRAWRTLVQALLVDVLAAVGAVLVVAATNIEWTPTYWKALGLAVAKSAVVAAVSFIARKVSPPAV